MTERETVLIGAVDLGNPLEDITDIYGVAIDVEDDEWKVVEFSGYECSWAQRYECTDNFGEFYAKYKGDIKRVGIEISNDEIAELLLDEARKMASRMVARHAETLAEEARRAEERRAAEEAERLELAKAQEASKASVNDEYDQAKMAELAKVYNATTGNDTKKCVPALSKVAHVVDVDRETCGMNVNDITVVVRKPGEGFDRVYYITFRPASIYRVEW